MDRGGSRWTETYVVTCKGPDLSRGACNCGNSGEEEEDDQEGNEYAGAGVGAGDLVNDIYDGVARVLRGSQKL